MFCSLDGGDNGNEQPLSSSSDRENDDDEVEQQAYRNRSWAWTRRYRKLIPYEKARRRAMDIGLRSKEEWDEDIENGNLPNGAYLPNHPDEMYQAEWISWDDFLGIMRPYEEARHIVKTILKLKTLEEYRQFVKADTQRAEGLRIPARPDIIYLGKGWDEDDFFHDNN